MRKIISLGLFALMLSIFSNQVFAGKNAVCEDNGKKDELKSLGLYGLCNAYWNADNAGNENAKAKILANFEKNAGTAIGGPGMPGLESLAFEQDFFCPCWDTLAEADIAKDSPALLCIIDNTTFEPIGDTLTFAQSAQGYFQGFNVRTSACRYDDYFTDSIGNRTTFVEIVLTDLTEDEEVACRLDIEKIASTHFGQVGGPTCIELNDPN